MRNLDLPPLSTRIALVLLSIPLAAATLAATPAAADIYRWMDARKGVHFTNDLGTVPSAQRPRAQRVRSEARSAHPTSVRYSTVATGRHVVAVDGTGPHLLVSAVLNESLEAPFVIDTGATESTIPRAVVERLGIRIDESTPRVEVVGIENRVIRAPVVTLQRLRVGGAVVDDVPMVVLDSIPEGLLGMAFLQRFHMQLDPGAGTLTLEESGSPSADRVASLRADER
jgi:clan AA aspartic protease (TIGR02281 family)